MTWVMMHAALSWAGSLLEIVRGRSGQIFRTKWIKANWTLNKLCSVTDYCFQQRSDVSTKIKTRHLQLFIFLLLLFHCFKDTHVNRVALNNVTNDYGRRLSNTAQVLIITIILCTNTLIRRIVRNNLDALGTLCLIWYFSLKLGATYIIWVWVLYGCFSFNHH